MITINIICIRINILMNVIINMFFNINTNISININNNNSIMNIKVNIHIINWGRLRRVTAALLGIIELWIDLQDFGWYLRAVAPQSDSGEQK